MLSREWRCSWSCADRRCSNYIWVIDNFIAYKDASYIRGLTVVLIVSGVCNGTCQQSGSMPLPNAIHTEAGIVSLVEDLSNTESTMGFCGSLPWLWMISSSQQSWWGFFGIWKTLKKIQDSLESGKAWKKIHLKFVVITVPPLCLSHRKKGQAMECLFWIC